MPKVKENLSARHLLRMTTEETRSRLTYLQTVENVSRVPSSGINTLLKSGSSCSGSTTSYLTHSEKEYETASISDKICTPRLLNNDSDSTVNTDCLDSHNIFNDPPDLNILLPNNPKGISKTPNLGTEVADLKHNIANWALENNISHVALSALLKILKNHPCHAELPSDARSFLRTPRHNEIKQISPGCYFHFGLNKELEHFVELFSYDEPVLELSIFVDGLPLSKSSSSCFWPILGSVVPFKHIFVIGIYHGYEKNFVRTAMQII